MSDLQAARGTSLSQQFENVDPLAPAGGRARRAVSVLAFGIAIIGIALDYFSKQWALATLGDGRVIQVVGDLVRFVLTHNPGAAFSSGTGFTPLIATFALVAALVVSVVIIRARSWLWGITLGLLLAGIVGNLLDRLFQPPGPMRGHVIDFIALPNWPIFNVADILINVAGAAAFLLVFRGHPLSGKSPSSAEQEQP